MSNKKFLICFALESGNSVTPQEIDAELRRCGHQAHWISMPIVDSVWLLLQFSSLDEKSKFIDSMPVIYKNFIAPDSVAECAYELR